MTEELQVKELPKPAKVSATHALSKLGFSIRKIAKILGIAKGSAEKYLKEIPQEEWDRFGTTLEKLVSIKEEEIATKALALIGKKLSKAEFQELIRLYKTIREIQGRVKSISGEEEKPSPIKIEINQRILKIITKAEDELENQLRGELKE